MKRYRLVYCLLVLTLLGFYSCDKENDGFNTPGGLLPTKYITIEDSTFSPSTITVANGNSFTFLNSTGVAHTLMSDDSTTLASITIAPDSSYFFKPDTATTVPVDIYIPYHCVQHPSARGVIILTQ
jgi:plastocyanin